MTTARAEFAVNKTSICHESESACRAESDSRSIGGSGGLVGGLLGILTHMVVQIVFKSVYI